MAQQMLRAVGHVTKQLGVLQAAPADYARRTRERRMTVHGLTDDAIQADVAARAEARKSKDFSKADGIRASLESRGVKLEDGPAGTEWHVEP